MTSEQSAETENFAPKPLEKRLFKLTILALALLFFGAFIPLLGLIITAIPFKFLRGLCDLRVSFVCFVPTMNQ